MAFAGDDDAIVRFIQDELRRSKLPKPDARRGQVDPKPHAVLLAPAGRTPVPPPPPELLERFGRVVLITRPDCEAPGWPEVRAVVPAATEGTSPAEQAYEYALLGTIAMHEVAAEIHRNALGAWTSVLLQPLEALTPEDLARAAAGLEGIKPGEDMIGKFALRFGLEASEAETDPWPVVVGKRAALLSAQGTPLAKSLASLVVKTAQHLIEAGVAATSVGKAGSLARLVSVGAHQGEPLQRMADAMRKTCVLETPLVTLLAKV